MLNHIDIITLAFFVAAVIILYIKGQK